MKIVMIIIQALLQDVVDLKFRACLEFKRETTLANMEKKY